VFKNVFYTNAANSPALILKILETCSFVLTDVPALAFSWTHESIVALLDLVEQYDDKFTDGKHTKKQVHQARLRSGINFFYIYYRLYLHESIF
jgi:hypothetical protein